MKSTWFKDSRQYEFAKTIFDSDYTRNNYDIFRDWLEAVFLCLRQANHRMFFGCIDESIEAQYMSVIKRVNKPEAFANALGLLVLAFEEQGPSDFLGDVFQAMGLNDGSWKGQFFTPYHLSQLMAILNFSGLDKDHHSLFNRLSIDEPACGAGGMIIASVKVLRDNDWSNRQFYFNASDIDIRCVQMTFIQTTLLDIPCLIHHMNTLSLECWGSYPTMALCREPLWDSGNLSMRTKIKA